MHLFLKILDVKILAYGVQISSNFQLMGSISQRMNGKVMLNFCYTHSCLCVGYLFEQKPHPI